MSRTRQPFLAAACQVAAVLLAVQAWVPAPAVGMGPLVGQPLDLQGQWHTAELQNQAAGTAEAQAAAPPVEAEACT